MKLDFTLGGGCLYVKTNDRKKLLLSDTIVPDLFISEYMSGLSGTAIQAYLYLMMTTAHGKSVGEREIAARFSISTDDAKGAIAELSLSGLIERGDKGKFFLTDIKGAEVDSYIARMGKELVSEAESISPLDQAREELARSIEKTFFHGSMAYKWYREVDILLFEYGFEPDVVYMLFQSLYDSKQLTTLTQMKEKALLWHSRGIRATKELSVFLSHEEEVMKILLKIGKKLRRKMTEFDEEYVRLWVEKLKYSYEVIEFAIRKMCEYNSSPNLKHADDHLMAWFAAGVQTLAEAEAYEAEAAKKNKMNYQREKAAKIYAPPEFAKQNFESIPYTEEEIKGFEDDPGVLFEIYSQRNPDSGSK
jgi:hypothetical protein